MSAAEVLGITLLSAKVALAATLLILAPAIAMGWLLARKEFPLKRLVHALCLLPMVLPPVAIGLLLLKLFASSAPLGRAANALFGEPLLLSWRAAAVASAVMSFPLLVLGARAGFAAVPARLEQVAATLGASPGATFLRITLPLASRAILQGTIFAFARALGEFGATTLVAGHIPGRTETLALAIYAKIEAFDDPAAITLSLVSLGVATAATIAGDAVLGGRKR